MAKAKRQPLNLGDPPALTGDYRIVPIGNVKPKANWNPRTVFDEMGLHELAVDIATHGIIEPLIVRPNGQGFLVVAGERRLRAATMLNMKELPVIVRDMTDQEAFEQTVSENLTRVNLHPIEEAEGFIRLQRDYLMEPREIARRTGKTSHYVVTQMVLANLSPAVRKGALDPSCPLQVGHLHVIAQVSNPDLQLRLMKSIIRPPHGGEMLSVKKAEGLLDQYQQPLSGAQFKLGDAELVKKAGSCFECPYNTTNLPREAFPKKDICTNVPCFQGKQKAAFVQLSKAPKSGIEVIPEKQGNKLFDKWSERLHYRSGYVMLDGSVYVGSKSKTYREWFKKGDDVPQTYAVFNPFTYRIEYIVSERDANAAINKIKAKLDPSRGKLNALTPQQKAAQKREKMEQEAKKLAVSKMTLQVVERVESTTIEIDPPIARALLLGLQSYTFSEAIQHAAKRRNIELSDEEKSKQSYEKRIILQKKLFEISESMETRQVFALAVEILLWEQTSFYSSNNKMKDIATLLGIDLDALQTQALKELKEADKAKSKKKLKSRKAAASTAGEAATSDAEVEIDEEEDDEE